jgi:tetratricopeptide (TPR) repeat protein
MLRTTSAVAALLAATATPALAQYQAPPQPQPAPQMSGQAAPAQPSAAQPSKKAQKAILDLQTAVNGGDPAAIAAAVAAAEAVASTAADRHWIGQLQLKAAIARKDYATAARALQAVRGAGILPTATIAKLYSGVGVDAYNARQYDLAASLFEGAIAVDPQNLELTTMLAEARFGQGRKAEGTALLQKVMQAHSAAGRKPPEELYKRVVQAAYDARSPSAAELARQWAVAYPNAQSWRNAVAIYRNTVKPDANGTLALMRLLRVAGALTTASDVTLYTSLLEANSNFVEAQAVVDQAVAANLVQASSPEVQDIRSRPKVTEADLAAAAKTAQSGMALLRVGDRFYGLGEYAKAADIYRQAMAKPGVDKNLANLNIGTALAAAGDKAGATAAFSSVTGTHAEVAKFWLAYLQSRA